MHSRFERISSELRTAQIAVRSAFEATVAGLDSCRDAGQAEDIWRERFAALAAVRRELDHAERVLYRGERRP